MNRKICSLALGAMAVLASANAFAALDEAEKMYVDRMLKGSWVSLRDVAQSLYNTGNTNTGNTNTGNTNTSTPTPVYCLSGQRPVQDNCICSSTQYLQGSRCRDAN